MKQSSDHYRLILFLCIFMLAGITFSCQKREQAETIVTKNDYYEDYYEITTSPYDKAFTDIDTMPEFKGGKEKLDQYIQDHLLHPESVELQGIQGRVLIRFVVNEDGSISDTEVFRSLDPDCDQSALDLVNNMPDWMPGILNGEKVKVLYFLPIGFGEERLSCNFSEDYDDISVSGDNDPNEIIFGNWCSPQYPGGREKLSAYIKNQIKYPKDAEERKIEGRVIVGFTVELDGSLSDIKIIRSVSPSIDSVALKAVNEMPKWIPGTRYKKKEVMKSVLPIRFQIDK